MARIVRRVTDEWGGFMGYQVNVDSQAELTDLLSAPGRVDELEAALEEVWGMTRSYACSAKKNLKKIGAYAHRVLINDG